MPTRRARIQIGDLIRIVRLPPAFDLPSYSVHADTRQVFYRLLHRGRPLRVYEIDRQGLPWVRCQFRNRSGRWIYHSLAVGNDAWVKVRKRRE